MWQPATGKVNENECAIDTALREIEEETGLCPSALYSADTVETFYMPDLDKITSIPVFVAFVDEKKVNLAPEEHDAHEWLFFEEAKPRLIWSEQRNSLTHIHEHFAKKEPNPLFLLSSKTTGQLK